MHLIRHFELKAKKEERAIKEAYKVAKEFAYYEGDRREGSDRYTGFIRVLSHRVFDSYNDAVEYLNKLEPYDDGIVQYKEGRGKKWLCKVEIHV